MLHTFWMTRYPRLNAALTDLRACRFIAAGLLSIALLAGCSGVPITSVPRLLRLNAELLDIKPAEFMVAIQMDARMTPPGGTAPLLDVDITPNTPDSFQPIS